MYNKVFWALTIESLRTYDFWKSAFIFTWTAIELFLISSLVLEGIYTDSWQGKWFLLFGIQVVRGYNNTKGTSKHQTIQV